MVTENTKLHAARYIKLDTFALITGYSRKACEMKIHNGVWLQGREYLRAPDGHILIDMEGFEKWVEKGMA